MNAFFSSSPSPAPAISGTPTNPSSSASLPSSPPPSWLISNEISGSGSGGGSENTKSEKYKEMEENISKQEKELRENVRDLLSALAQRDQIYAASRKAYQKLNKECKLMIYTILKKIIEKEKEALSARQTYLEKFEEKVNCIDLEQDELEFIESHVGEYSNDGELILQSQALSILGDIHILEKQHAEIKNSSTALPTTAPTAAPVAPPAAAMSGGGSGEDGGRRLSGSEDTCTSISVLDTPLPVSASPSTESVGSSSNQMEQTHQHFSNLFYLSEWSIRNTSPISSPLEILSALKIKSTIQRGSLTQSVDLTDDTTSVSAPVSASASAPSAAASGSGLGGSDSNQTTANLDEVESSIFQLCHLCDSTEGRKLFVNVLNQFRSKKVEVGLGFAALGAVVWYLLTKCLHVNDVHNAKIIMILSQVSASLSLSFSLSVSIYLCPSLSLSLSLTLSLSLSPSLSLSLSLTFCLPLSVSLPLSLTLVYLL
jgi:hypothetical protein